MKIHSLVFGVVTAGCLALPRLASAQVSTDDFNALKDTVQKMGQQVQEQRHLVRFVDLVELLLRARRGRR